MANILVCDDDKDIVRAISIYLKAEGYTVYPCYDGTEAVKLVETEDLDLVILDIMMPGMDGMSALVSIREKHNVPVIFLTAKSEDTDLIMGLSIGADDYITKPFNPVELMARVKSQIRRYTLLGGHNARTEAPQENLMKLGNIELNDSSKMVFVDGEDAHLTPTEFDILRLLMEQPGKVFSPTEIYEAVWHDTILAGENTVAVHIRHLREKIEITPSKPRFLKVVWGRGYKIEE